MASRSSASRPPPRPPRPAGSQGVRAMLMPFLHSLFRVGFQSNGWQLSLFSIISTPPRVMCKCGCGLPGVKVTCIVHHDASRGSLAGEQVPVGSYQPSAMTSPPQAEGASCIHSANGRGPHSGSESRSGRHESSEQVTASSAHCSHSQPLPLLSGHLSATQAQPNSSPLWT